MAKGSQLVQLKSALSQAGVIGQKPNGKKRKRTAAPLEKDKQKAAAKLEEIHRKLNPFDEKVTKLKHNVGGRKLKGVTGKPARSKQAGLEQRKKTLLKEWEEKDRAGGIVDRRFGENNPNMSLEERMLERFTRERQRASKSSAFNIEDKDELTHYGQSLSKMDDFDDVALRSEDDEDEEMTSGKIGRDIVSRGHFGGFGEEDEDEEGPARKKSKAEVMAEVMAKSKEHKIRRQAEKDMEDGLRTQLDDQFADLRELLFTAQPVLDTTNEEATSEQVESAIAPGAKDSAYDQQVRDLALDKRSKAKERTKTEEELALEAKEELEKAEQRRRRRMEGIEESDDEEAGRKGKRKRGGDDLEDDFVDEEWGGLGAGLGGADVDDEDGSEGEEDDDSEGEEGEGDSGEEQEEESGEEGSEEEFEGEDGEHEELVHVVKASKAKGKAKAVSGKELPYTFSCPESHEEFLEIIEGVADQDLPIVLQRMRALHHTSLAPENKFKLQTLANVLIDHILYVSSSSPPQLNVITSLFPHLNAIVRAYPIPAARHFNSKLSLMHKNLKRGLSKGALESDSKTWPGLPELSLLRVIPQLWPSSDLNHAVISPTRVLMGSYLGLCRVRSLGDIASGLFLCTLWLQYEALSKRLVPEAVNFLLNAALHTAPHSFKSVESLPGAFPSPDFRSDLCKPLRMAKSKKTADAQPPNLPELLEAESNDEQAKADLLGLALNLLGRFADFYKGLDGFIELFSPAQSVVQSVDGKKLAPKIQSSHATLLKSLERLLRFAQQAREPLRLQAHKPIPIPTYIPKFESSTSNFLRQRDPDYEKNETAKLKSQYKQERKGAIRELRKDARFLASVEHQRQMEKDKAYNSSMKKAFTSIEGERAEQKAMEREKAKDKRRKGKK
ncbi:Nop14-like protein [Coprinellus micaceus]|uniref:Nop14-like protein n=1 Tax=Coprinellus micaceus TaxID=71717 RepID=A0A4Y7TSC3_COPMI|nr:Nop14-like protein [Coprinellus micaceus]